MLISYSIDTSAYDSIVANQKELKKAKLADDLNEKIFYRPGAIELLEKNILHADETVSEAIKGNIFVIYIMVCWYNLKTMQIFFRS